MAIETLGTSVGAEIIPKHPRVLLPVLEGFFKDNGITMDLSDVQTTGIEDASSPEDVSGALHGLLKDMRLIVQNPASPEHLQLYVDQHKSMQKLIVRAREMCEE